MLHFDCLFQMMVVLWRLTIFVVTVSLMRVKTVTVGDPVNGMKMVFAGVTSAVKDPTVHWCLLHSAGEIIGDREREREREREGRG